MIGIRMLKLCDESFCKSLNIFFSPCQTPKPQSPSLKSDKQTNSVLKTTNLFFLFAQFAAKLSNVLFIKPCSHIFQKTTSYRKINQELSPVTLLSAITYEIFSSFDDNYEFRGVFLDIPKAFDKVCHEGIIHKLKRNGISGDLLSRMKEFLKNGKRRVIRNGQCLSWVNINAGKPTTSTFGKKCSRKDQVKSVKQTQEVIFSGKTSETDNSSFIILQQYCAQ